MDFEAAVKAFQAKKNPRAAAEEKREAYKKLVKDFNKLKYAPSKHPGERVERPITDERIQRHEAAKNRVVPDVTNDLLDFVKDAKK
jgi:hypothetical protein